MPAHGQNVELMIIVQVHVKYQRGGVTFRGFDKQKKCLKCNKKTTEEP